MRLVLSDGALLASSELCKYFLLSSTIIEVPEKLHVCLVCLDGALLAFTKLPPGISFSLWTAAGVLIQLYDFLASFESDLLAFGELSSNALKTVARV